jgi:hypothetical protein
MPDRAAFHMLLLTVTSWLDRREWEVRAYLIEENRVLRQQLDGRRQRLTDDDRRNLAARAYRLGRKALARSRRSRRRTRCSAGMKSTSGVARRQRGAARTTRLGHGNGCIKTQPRRLARVRSRTGEPERRPGTSRCLPSPRIGVCSRASSLAANQQASELW